jgi:ATP phosphoribosyltransferase
MSAVVLTPASSPPLLRVAVPNKGALSDAAVEMLHQAGYAHRSDPKELLLIDEANRVEFF